MRIRNIKLEISLLAGTLILALTLGSCVKYLDKAPAATITDKDAFGNFISFQGFIETMYNGVVDVNKAGAWNQYLFADETLYNSPYAFDQGNYWSQGSYQYGTNADLALLCRNKRVWPLAWYCIRVSNLALSKLPLLTDATQEEKDVIKGQALYWRAWYHFELARWWGGLPYIDTVLTSTGEMKKPRLSFQETMKRAAADFRAAADLLPANWDLQPVGQRTIGNNLQRVSKVWALGYMGKALLYGGSPMPNEEVTGSNTFNAEMCKQAAAALGEALKVCDDPKTPYKLQTWATWTDCFWVWGNANRPRGTEGIMEPTFYDDRTRWSTVGATCPGTFGGNTTSVEVPTNNYVKNYAMANGLPIDNPASGFNPADPWTGREPRFYSDIIIDGDRMCQATASGPDMYAQLYTGGRHRSTLNGSVTGFFYKRYSPLGCNQWDAKWDNFQAFVPYLRLADIYLMYSEAVLQGFGTAVSSDPTYGMTAADALNIIRRRGLNLPLYNISATYTATKDAFMGEIMRERAVELGYEGHRFHDIRRWNVATLTKYKDKTAVDFDRATNGKPINITERVVITRVAEKKHNWLPFQVSFTKLYPTFGQNPGW